MASALDLERRAKAVAWFREFQDSLTATLEAHEPEGAQFERTSWDRPGGGGGTMAVLRGETFEKAGVNVSEVHGTFSEQFAKEIPGADQDPRFWAAGVSVVIHPKNPQVPTAHMNTRLMMTSRSWWGGGGDLTPMAPHKNPEEAALFHRHMQGACDAFDPSWYESMRQACADYFYIPHRKEERGAGGIFYDMHDTGDWEADLAFTKAVGRAFETGYDEVVTRCKDQPFDADDRAHQLFRRGRYAEFNLVYDRGTRFGLQTDGNIDAILMSLPPLAAWP